MDITKPILAVFAHPDDETFGIGGLLALAHAKGARTGVFCATRGEKGRQHLAEPMSPEALGEARTKELQDAAQVLGVDRVQILGYPDGGLDQVPKNEIIQEIIAAIKEFRPHTVVTFGPDGATGHKDHIAIHHLTHLAFSEVQKISSHPQELYWYLFPAAHRELFDKLIGGRRRRTEGHYSEEDCAISCDEAHVETINVSSVIATKVKAFAMHRTQGPESYVELSPSERDALWGTEHYYRAYPPQA